MPPRLRTSLSPGREGAFYYLIRKRGRPVFGECYSSYLMSAVVTILASHLNTMISLELVMNRIDSSLFSQKPGHTSWIQREKNPVRG